MQITEADYILDVQRRTQKVQLPTESAKKLNKIPSGGSLKHAADRPSRIRLRSRSPSGLDNRTKPGVRSPFSTLSHQEEAMHKNY